MAVHRINEEKWLRERGWSTWYHDNYWVHPDLVVDKASQDYTNYGMSLSEALEREKSGRKKYPPLRTMFKIVGGR